MDATIAETADPSLLNDIGVSLADQGLFDEAIEQYRLADELWAKANSPDRKYALVNWARALRSKKLYEEAGRKYREAIEADPEYAYAQDGLGLVLADQGHFDEAIEQYRRAHGVVGEGQFARPQSCAGQLGQRAPLKEALRRGRAEKP